MNIKYLQMKKIVLFLAAAMFMLPQIVEAKKENTTPELKVMSYNIRMGTADDGTNSWQFRYPATYEMLKDQAPDVVGIQEAFDFQVAYMEEYCGYEAVGVGRDDGKKKGEQMSILWNKKTVKMIKWGTFWLSETPDKPSRGWDAKCFRTATWALMKCKKTGKKFYFVNTHLDHKGVEARRNGLNLIVDRIAEINPEGYPMVLTGDFNITPDNEALVDLDKKMDSVRKIAEKTDNLPTFNGWGKRELLIDYIYVKGFSAYPEYQTVTKKYSDRKFVSDHYPIIAKLIF